MTLRLEFFGGTTRPEPGGSSILLAPVLIAVHTAPLPVVALASSITTAPLGTMMVLASLGDKCEAQSIVPPS